MMIFDGHNDLLSNLMRSGAIDDFATGLSGHIDAVKLRDGQMVGGFFAIWVPSNIDFAPVMEEMRKPAYDVPALPELPFEEAKDITLVQAQILHDLQDAGQVKICTTTDEIRACRDTGLPAAILHLEGAEGIDPEFEMLDQLYELGLRSLGPVWSRTTRYADGVSFTFPGSPDTGPGLTEDGHRLVERCNEKGILLDLAHMTEAGFWDVAEHSNAPLVATHSNAHAICAHSRNLTDAQLRKIGESGGVVGLNFATAMLRPDGQMRPDVGFDVMLAHLDHMMAQAGADHVAQGSDFDGAVVPEEIKDASGLPHLVTAMERHGYSAALIEKICFETWMRVLDATWP